jgi:hypothetical protein
MLDDLARDPDNVAKYQTEDSSRSQIFAFTSCGFWWEVYLAWNFLGNCVSRKQQHHFNLFLTMKRSLANI